MTKVRDGDLDRLGVLFERYKRPLYGFFYGMNRQQELCEDLVQNTFLRILKYRHLFRADDGEGGFRAWMFQIARNVNFDHHRKNRIRATEELEDWQDRLGHTDHQSARLMQAEDHDLLALALERLPLEKREVLVLSKYQEKKYTEIGEILGCTEGAVKVKVFRALQELREVYQKLEKQL